MWLLGLLTPPLCPQAALDRLRRGILDALAAFQDRHGLRRPAAILDIGCSVGQSTRCLADEYPEARGGGALLASLVPPV